MPQERDKRIAYNTLLLYSRMFIMMAAGLYISRAVLATLGVDDFGIYNVVDGIVVIFAFLNGAMVGSSQRFISFELGRKNRESLNKVFSTSVNIHGCLALFILLIAETAGLWFLNTRMNIAPDRITAANWVYQCSLFAFMMNVTSVPYLASITAHEHMKAFAFTGISDVLLKLGIACLIILCNGDKLILYAGFLLAESIVIQIVYRIYCRRNFPESKYRLVFDKQLFYRMFAFAGWSFIGTMAHSLRSSGVNIVLNLFCGVAVNAARGITIQVGNVINNFASNFQMAINPQITKSYASGEYEYTRSLITRSSRYSFYLLSVLVIPVFINADCLLGLWLTEVPEYTPEFLRLTLFVILIDCMTNPMSVAIQATGKVRNFNLIVGAILSLDLPLSYLILKLGYTPYTVMYVSILTSAACLFARLLIMKRSISYSARRFFVDVLLKNVLLTGLSLAVLLYVKRLFPENFPSLLLVFFLSVAFVGTAIYAGCLTRGERAFIRKKTVEKILCR